MKKELAYRIGEKVFIISLERPGRVVEISIDIVGTMYKVRYFDHAVVNAVFFFKDELEKK